MQAIGVLLFNAFAAIFEWFARRVILEKGFKIAAIVTLLALVAGLYLLMNDCSTGACSSALISVADRYPSFATGLSIAFNSVTYTSMSLYMLVWTACQLYILKKRMMTMLQAA